MFSGIGLPEVLIVLVIALVVLGPKRLPEVGKSLGKGMREFKDSISGDDKDELETSYTTPSTPVSTPASTPVSTPASTSSASTPASTDSEPNQGSTSA